MRDGEKVDRRRKRLHLASIVVLIAGLCAAAAIYFQAGDSYGLEGAYQVEIINGTAYPVSPSDSRAYQREMERIGGKTYLLFDDLNRWIASLFQGKRLAFTVGICSLVVSLGLFLLGQVRESDPSDEP